jgi:predicted DNA-binding helix-hairpin-helix protein
MDWLKRVYRFSMEELNLAFDKGGFLSLEQDPKTLIALANLDAFPVDVNGASREQLLRVPGIGPTAVQRIVQTRRRHSVDTWRDLQAMGVVRKRAWPFLAFPGQRPPRGKQLKLDLFRAGLSGEQPQRKTASLVTTPETCGHTSPCALCPMYGMPGHPGPAP